VCLLRFSRNFGHQVAISAGIDHASGNTITVIDADLQDPPEVIATFVERWRAGADVVYGVRTERRDETAFKRASAALFYRILRALSDVEIPVDTGDFRLLGREAADALRSMPEHHRYIRGLVAWLGFVAEGVPYARDPRIAGVTKYPLGKMVRFALDGIMAFSMRPLRLAAWTGMLISVAAFVTGIGVIVYRLAGGEVVQGWASLTVLVLFLAGVQLMTIGVLGEYVGRIYSEVRARPLYLLRDMRGFPGKTPREPGRQGHGA
jgi:dolichol-phosphate mannosyltransferase